MTIHELYKQKEYEYEQYRIQKGVLDSKVEEAKVKMLDAVKELQSLIPTIEGENIRQDIEDIVGAVAAQEAEFSIEFLTQLKQKLEAVAVMIEQEVRSALQ